LIFVEKEKCGYYTISSMAGGDCMIINLKPIGKRIKAIRKSKGITQAQLAEMTNMSNIFISRIETGAKNVSLTSLIKIAVALNVTIDELVLLDEVIELCNDFEIL